jgi:alpha-L-fucosidase
MTITTGDEVMQVTETDDVPSYLSGYEDRYREDPRAAAVEWFSEAEYGLFLHYGLYSLLGEHEWIQYLRKIPPAEYALLQDYFTAEHFDAEAIAEFADECGMNYVTLTTRHCESFCLFDTDQTTFNSVAAPAGRDLVGELAEACRERGLGLFLYYIHGFDWRHPHAPNRDEWGDPVRPDYDETPRMYAEDGHDLQQYEAFVSAQITELLTEYGPIAGIWLDPTSVPQRDPDRFTDAFDLDGLYETIRELQPQTLISYKDGVTGDEDFVSTEHEPLEQELDKPGEICTTMVPGEAHRDEIGHIWGYGEHTDGADKHVATSWGYAKRAEGMHKTSEEVWELLETARQNDYNLLINTGLRPDGSIDPEDERALREVGDRLADEGFPGAR